MRMAVGSLELIAPIYHRPPFAFRRTQDEMTIATPEPGVKGRIGARIETWRLGEAESSSRGMACVIERSG
jgi:hypothetical protein